MIIAHIKSPLGDRTEEWDDKRVKPEFKRYQREFDVYVVGFEGDDGKEHFAFFDKEYWDVHEEVVRFYAGEGSYSGLMVFLRTQLKIVGSNFQKYMPMERQLLEQAAIPAEQLEDFGNTIDDMGESNRASGELLEVVVRGCPPEQPPEEPEGTMYRFLHGLYDFTFLFDDSLLASRDLISGLSERAAGEEYSSLDYLRELNILRKAVEARQKHEEILTAARKSFLALPPEGIALRAEPAAPMPEDPDAPAEVPAPEMAVEPTTMVPPVIPPSQEPPAA